MNRYYIFVDDERNFDFTTLHKDTIFVACRSYRSAIEALNQGRDNGWDIWLDLDHDLGEEKTGYDICKFIVENEIPLHCFRLHTMNPVGKQNMRQLLSHYGYEQF